MINFQTALKWIPLALILALSAEAYAQDDGDPPGGKPPSREEVKALTEKSRELLRNLAPRSSSPSVPYAQAPDQPTARLETAAGLVQWGNLFTPGETVALVTLEPPRDPDDPFHLEPRYVSMFGWKDGRWELRQFLGNVSELSVHHRRDKPSAFLQGSRRYGRYEGDYLSWFYDPTSGQLRETHFEDWGPFFLVGPYLILGNGFQRLAHDGTHWVYAYKDGKKGRLLASLHEDDRGKFDIDGQDPASGQMQAWSFQPVDNGGGSYEVSMKPNPKNRLASGDEEGGGITGKMTEEAMVGTSAEDYFGFLTGLNPVLLRDQWLDDVPALTPHRLPVKATGDAVIVKRFSPAGLVAKDEREALALMADTSPQLPMDAGLKKLSLGANRGAWGKLFGDSQVAAVVALNPECEKGQPEPSEATLCLLLWDHGWKFVQRAGLVSNSVDPDSEPDWEIKRTAGGAEYLVSHRGLYPPGEHLSWRFDPATHSLIPTGWPNDAVPSLAGGFITFIRQDKPDNGRSIRDVYRFADRPTDHLARLRDDETSHERNVTMTLWQNDSSQAVTWQVHQVGPGNRYALCRTEGEQAASAFHEDATLDLQWADPNAEHDARTYIWSRLSGLSANSLNGEWDDKKPGEVGPPPSTVIVTGLPEAVRRLSLPPVADQP